MTRHYFESKFDKQKIYYAKWTKVKKPKGIVHVVHGTNEYIERYQEFATILNKAGFLVYAMDLRGHGQTGKESIYGFFARHQGHQAVYQDILQMHGLIKKEYPGLSLALFGHSLGSFIVRGYANHYYDIDKLIAMGTNHKSKKTINLLKNLARFNSVLGAKKPGKIIAANSYGALAKKFPDQSPFAWISYNEANWEDHYHPLYPKFLLTNRGFYDLSRWMRDYHQVQLLAAKNPQLQVLLVAGQDDPVGSEGKEVKAAQTHYLKHHIATKLILYPHMRHEILYEKNKKQVYEDIIAFLKPKKK